MIGKMVALGLAGLAGYALFKRKDASRNAAFAKDQPHNFIRRSPALMGFHL